MGKQLKQIYKNRKENVIVNQLSQSFDEGLQKGFHSGLNEAMGSFVNQVSLLREVEGMTDELFGRIVAKLGLKELIK